MAKRKVPENVVVAMTLALRYVGDEELDDEAVNLLSHVLRYLEGKVSNQFIERAYWEFEEQVTQIGD